MKDKNYYIPEIKELHPGMDIELFYQKGEYTCPYEEIMKVDNEGDTPTKMRFIPTEPNKTWHKEIISISKKDTSFWHYPLRKLIEYIGKKRLRIKHLDENDFDKLNWERYGTAPKGILYRGYKNERLQSVRIIYTPQSKHVLVYAIDTPLHEQTVFAGRVQNISELKVIINQLKIKPV